MPMSVYAHPAAHAHENAHPKTQEAKTQVAKAHERRHTDKSATPSLLQLPTPPLTITTTSY